MFQYDNTQSELHSVPILEWSKLECNAQIHDLSPTEHLWHEPECALEAEGAQIPTATLQNPVERLNFTITAKGDYIWNGMNRKHMCMWW